MGKLARATSFATTMRVLLFCTYRSKQRENPRLSDVVDLERFLTLRHLVGYTDLILIML